MRELTRNQKYEQKQKEKGNLMKDILSNFKKCIELKQQSEKLGKLQITKKAELAEQAVGVSLSVIGGLIDQQTQTKRDLNSALKRLKVAEDKLANLE